VARSRTFDEAVDAFGRGALELAEALCRHVLEDNPRHAEALHLLGVVLGRTRRFADAAAALERSVAVDPDNAYSRSDLAAMLRMLGRSREALEHLERSVELDRSNAAAFNERGLALHALQRPAEAADSYAQAIALAPQLAEAHFNLGVALSSLRRPEAALGSFERVTALDPGHADAHLQRGNVLVDLGRPAEALAAYEQAIAVRADLAEAHNNRGCVLLDLKRPQPALESFARAVALRPDFDEAINNHGNALRDLGRLAEALYSYEKAIALRPANGHAHANRGAALYGLNRFAESVASADRAIALDPELAKAHNNRGLALVRLKRYEEAVRSFRRAMELDGNIELLAGNLLMAQLHLCDWEDFDGRLTDLEQRIGRGENATPPYAVLALTDSPRLQLEAARIHAARSFPANPALGPIARTGGAGRIRIGYFSADFRTHPSSHLLADLFEIHDRSAFEFTGFYFGPDVRDDMTARLSAAFDRFIEVGARSDRDVALLSRELQIDIAVDLMGYTEHSRPGIFALRAAPVQVNYLGYPGTSGAEYLDYIVADRTVIPHRNRLHFSESVACLPQCFQPNDRRRALPTRQFTRRELGLPETGRVFAGFHSSYKITPSTFDGWMRILGKVAGSVLWLREDTPEVVANLRREAQRRGVDPRRLVFAPRVDLADHIARHRQADLFLDAFPFNAHTSASDALWSGLPLLTRSGESYISRVGASLLTAVGLPELVTRSQDEFEELAVRLAGDEDRLRQLQQRLAASRASSPLFDTPRYARHLEAAYIAMFERHRSGLPPADIEVVA